MAKQILPNGIGNIVMYSLSTGIKVPIQDILQGASAYNIPTHLLAQSQSTTGAFKKACTEVAGDISRGGTPCVRKIMVEDNEQVIIVFEKRTDDTVEDIEAAIAGEDYVPTYPPVLRLIYSKLSGKVEDAVVYRECGNDVYSKVMEKFWGINNVYTIKQMRATIQSAFNYYGSIKMRHNGGVNFVPHTRIKEWRNFTNFIEQFEGVQIMELSVGNTQHNRNTVRTAFEESVHETLEDEIKRLGGMCEGHKQLNELVSDFAQVLHEYAKGVNRESQRNSLANMLGRFKEVMANVQTYKDLLDADLSAIDTQVDVAKKQLMSIVNKFNGVEEEE